MGEKKTVKKGLQKAVLYFASLHEGETVTLDRLERDEFLSEWDRQSITKAVNELSKKGDLVVDKPSRGVYVMRFPGTPRKKDPEILEVIQISDKGLLVKCADSGDLYVAKPVNVEDLF